MSFDSRRVVLYVMDANDGCSTDEKLRITARKYLSAESVTEQTEVARTERGKPYFPHLPKLHCSPSHSGDYFICAMADFPVGADIQIHKGLRDESPEEAAARLKRIAKRYFSPAEAEFLQTDTCDRFFRLWTARESYVKLTGQGIDGSFAEYCVLPADADDLPTMEAGGIAKWRALDGSFCQMRLSEGFTLCICAREDFSLEVVWLTGPISK